MSNLVIQNVTVTNAAGHKIELKGVSEPAFRLISPGVVMAEFMSPLGSHLDGAAILQPGMMFQYGDKTVTSSQIDSDSVKKIQLAD